MDASVAEPSRIVYFGTPDYAVPALRALASDPRVRIELVVSQPDRPAGRGRKRTAPPVSLAAESLGLPVYRPETLRTAADRAPIAALDADLFVVAAFGKIFGPRLLSLPKLGAVNLHASILPDYRGANPIACAILEGAFRTGVTLMQMDTGLDTGPILAQQSLDILPADTTASLTPKLAQLGADLLIASLDELLAGALAPVPQDDTLATMTRPMVKADGWIDWTQSARFIERQVRAMWDWPRAWTTLRGTPLQLHQVEVRTATPMAEPGSVSIESDGAIVATGDGALLVRLAQIAGGKPVAGKLLLEKAASERVRLGVENAPPLPELPLIRPAV